MRFIGVLGLGYGDPLKEVLGHTRHVGLGD